LPPGIANALRMSSCAWSSSPCSMISPGLLMVSEIVTTLDERRTAVVIRSMIRFWNRAASSCMALHATVAPASICLLVSGCRPGLPKVTLPVNAVVKLAPSSVAVGARKPEEAPARKVSQSSAWYDAPAA
jgi:hypothetical protein